MIHAAKKLRSPLKYHGGKSYLARRIIALFPEHETYVEPFIGGGSILLNKPPSVEEVAADLNEDLIHFWRQLRDCPHSWPLLLSEYDYNEDSFNSAVSPVRGRIEDLDYAIRFLVRNRMSRGGLGKDFAWSDRLRGGQPGDVNAWDTFRADISSTIARISDVMFLAQDALETIEENDGSRTLVYCDPPYLPETRTAKKIYEHEMAPEGHIRLLNMLMDCASKVVLSGYRNPLYDHMLSTWERHEFSMPNHSGQGKTKQRRIECVWVKP